MDKKSYYLAALIGSSIGGFVPTLFGSDLFSLASILGSGVGALIAIFLIHKFLNY